MNRHPPVLVLEDIDEDFGTVVEAARRTGIDSQIQRAVSGSECVRMMRAFCDHPSTAPGLVLLDLDSQGGDGREALIQLKSDARLRTVPVVILTTSSNPRDIQFCYQNQANAYHIKPVNHVIHLQTLEQIFTYWLSSTLLPIERPLGR